MRWAPEIGMARVLEQDASRLRENGEQAAVSQEQKQTAGKHILLSYLYAVSSFCVLFEVHCRRVTAEIDGVEEWT